MLYTIIGVLLWVGAAVAWVHVFNDVYFIHKNKGAKMMRNKILATLAALTCCIFCASPLCVGAALPPLLVLLADTAFSDFIGRSLEKDEDGNRKGFVGALRDYQSLLPEGLFLNPIIVNDEISFRVPNYYVITGKMHLTGDFVYYDENDTPYNTVTANQGVRMYHTLYGRRI